MRSTALLKSHADRIGAAPGCEQRGLVDEVGKIRACKARRERRNLLGIDVGCELRLPQMDLEDVDPSLLVGPIDQDLAIETAGAQQRRIKNFGAVGRRQNHKAGPRIEAVHVDKKLIEGLLLLVVAAR